MTSPVLMKNSVCTAGLSHDGVPMVLLIEKPEQQREDDVFDARSSRTRRCRRGSAPTRQARRSPAARSRNGATRAADQRDADRADDQESEADIENLDQIVGGEHALGRRGGMAADFGRRARRRRAASRATPSCRPPLRSPCGPGSPARRAGSCSSATTLSCWRVCASRSIWSSAAVQPGVSEAIWLSVVQRKVGTTLRRSNTFHWNSTSTVVMTRKPSTTAIQSSVRHGRVVGGRDLAGRNGADGCLDLT